MTQNVFFEAIAYTNMHTKLLPHVKGMCPVHRYTSWWSESRTPFTSTNRATFYYSTALQHQDLDVTYGKIDTYPRSFSLSTMQYASPASYLPH